MTKMKQKFIKYMVVNNTLQHLWLVLFSITVLIANTGYGLQSKKLKALIIDGQNHHVVWPKTTIMLKHYLEATGRYTVAISRTRFLYKSETFSEWLPYANVGVGVEGAPKTDPEFRPDFSKYDVVISNFGYNAAPWPEQTQRNFETYMANGGGFVSIHSADNCFPNWEAYNTMIALGGWGGRTDAKGVYLYVDEMNKVKKDRASGPVGVHGKREAFVVTTYAKRHPITKGLPTQWMHATDECYAYLRGPAENVRVLATAVSTKKAPELQQKEPVVMAIDYKKGRIFHTTLGHQVASFECVGFITLFTRGVEWAATGKVKRKRLPKDFPTPTEVSRRVFKYNH